MVLLLVVVVMPPLNLKLFKWPFHNIGHFPFKPVFMAIDFINSHSSFLKLCNDTGRFKPVLVVMTKRVVVTDGLLQILVLDTTVLVLAVLVVTNDQMIAVVPYHYPHA